MTIGERIAAWREDRGLDQAALAKKMEVHASSVCRWEAGGSEPNYSSLKAIATALGITLEEFFGPTPEDSKSAAG